MPDSPWSRRLQPAGRGCLRVALVAWGLAGLVAWSPAGPAAAAGLDSLKIGVVNINTALNESMAGERSKSILLTSKGQLEIELKSQEEALKKKREELKNNIMLTDDARRRKEQELRTEERTLRRRVQNAQRELQEKERKLTESIFIELKVVIVKIAEEEQFDLVLEQNASQVILYSGARLIDITDKVIERYNAFQRGQ